MAIGMKVARTIRDMIMALECTLSTLKIRRGQGQPQNHDIDREPCCHPSAAYRAPRETQEQPAPTDKPMPTETDRAPLSKIYKLWIAGCTMHDVPCARALTVTLWVNRKPVPALLDSGSTIILAHSSVLPKAVEPKGSLAVTCVHGDVK